MAKLILGKKVEMTRIWKDGKVVPCTLISVGPCFVTQLKTLEKDGYEAVQIGFEKKVKNIKKTEKGKEFKHLCEIKESPADYQVGQQIDFSIFSEGEKVKIMSVSKGKGFQGAVKRWNFKGRNQTHGVKHEQRAVGSIGATGPGRVFPGRKMPGRMGSDQITVANLEIAKVDLENSLIAIKGAVPGHRGTLVQIKN
ncbi:MAG: 50S ribosomal protein L3 [Candidatus Gribaldobacteria bacterium]|nr:50S ribosomal protein L3 [Candidatus Gribaldobacteria bacterium]